MVKFQIQKVIFPMPTPSSAEFLHHRIHCAQKTQHIFIVEDQSELAELLAQELVQNGFETTISERGDTALQHLRATPPDLLILDWMLPGLSGLEVLRQFRGFSSVPVLMVSAMASEMDRVLGLELGADDYMAKPFSMPELIAKVRALLRRTQLWQLSQEQDRQNQVDNFHHGNLVLHASSRQVTLRQRPIYLTKSEFELLYLLLKNPARAFSREYLLETLWPDVSSGCDRSVDNTVLKLRKKLKPWGENIETVWGIGYRLSPAG